ncbi:peptidase M20 [bacterium (candidate division B38) B3_B38]|nr:MAG: peptidase M20 [bacterium (candidate division B38) B3_B38]
MSEVLSYFRQNRERIVELLEELVKLESPSLHKPSCDKLAIFLWDQFTSSGIEATILEQQKVGSFLRVEFGQGEEQILVLCHMDTVWSLGEVRRRPVKRQGEKLYGPGAYDMKGGICLGLFSLKAIKELELSLNKRVVIIINSDEEIGSHFSRPLIEAEAKSSKAVLCLEPAIPGGKLKTSRKGVGVFTLRIKGRAAHTAGDYKQGVSAIHELAHHILKIHKLSDPRRGLTLNVGRVEGGTLSNVVAATSEAEIDLRFIDPADGEKVVNQLYNLRPILPGISLEVSGAINRPPLLPTPQNQSLFRRAQEIALSELNLQLEAGMSGGGSDANFTSALGIPTLDGLGVDGDGAHSVDEFVLLPSLVERGALLTELLVKL